MMRLSTKGRYGTRLMLDLALHYGEGLVFLKDIAKREEISVGYLEHLIPPLKSAGLIKSSRGAHGGYSLAKEPSEINLREIVQVFERFHCWSFMVEYSKSELLFFGMDRDIESLNEKPRRSAYRGTVRHLLVVLLADDI